MSIGALPELILSLLRSKGAEQLQVGKDNPLSQFKPGQQYEGKVIDSLPNGRNIVQIGSQAMNMALPQQARTGDVLRLTFLNSGPRPTFVLNTSPLPASTSAQPVNVSRAAQQVNALIRYMPVSAPAPAVARAPAAQASAVSTTPSGATPAPSSNQAATQATVAATAGAALTRVISPDAPVATATGVRTLASTPTLAQATAQTAAMANAGIANARPIIANPAVLLAPAPTPQVAMTALPGAAIPAMAMAGEAVEGLRPSLGAQSSLVMTQGVASEKTMATHVLPMRLQQTVKESGLFYESHLGKWSRGEVSLESVQREPQSRLLHTPGPLLDLPDLEGMPEQAARLASRQLAILEGGPFYWQGQVWPGQTADWSIQEHEAGDPNAETEGQKWRSKLRLTLPRLGEVSADLDIGALGLRIRLRSPTPETLAELKSAMPELVGRMRDAEVNLTSLRVELTDGQ